MATSNFLSNTRSTNLKNIDLNSYFGRLDTIFFSETNARHWAFFRIGTALVALSLMLSLRADLLDLYGKFGYIQGDLIDISLPDYQLRLSYLMHWLGIAEDRKSVV